MTQKILALIGIVFLQVPGSWALETELVQINATGFKDKFIMVVMTGENDSLVGIKLIPYDSSGRPRKPDVYLLEDLLPTLNNPSVPDLPVLGGKALIRLVDYQPGALASARIRYLTSLITHSRKAIVIDVAYSEKHQWIVEYNAPTGREVIVRIRVEVTKLLLRVDRLIGITPRGDEILLK